MWALGYFPGDHEEEFRISSEIESVQSEIDALTEEHGSLQKQVSELPEDDSGVAEAQLKMTRIEQSLKTHEESIEEPLNQLNVISASLIENSYLGRMGKTIEPVVKPLGWDWRIGIGAIASFPAREVIIATLGTIFSLGSELEEGDPGLSNALMNATWPDGSPLITIPVALSIMVFFALCAQCGATLMVIRRETNSWRWPIFTFTYMTLLAYIASFLTYQIGTALGI